MRSDLGVDVRKSTKGLCPMQYFPSDIQHTEWTETDSSGSSWGG